ncbi:5-methyltetrahydropteroyltriglutamate--homocysteine methyltransferase [Altererythrobacter atlanticus]|uniref:Methionine synthase n=1 Tax=Croceibacterium atlanticum TaxID=1267766 RepID=A0A0F7KW13_9SPHN|nr:methionine synthase [Croceibacterium atlanticum]MBB5733656.1 5-methyltetrahydropteroyltriglutamate--homocysteine methyltransferase [Croceibacterium atlanticum]
MIKTTHVGSLPRGPELVPLLLARDKGEPYDVAEFDAKVQAAIDEAVAKQVEAGVSVVSDGELGKVGYSTYIIERLSGFGGHTPRKPALDLAQVPELTEKLSGIMGKQEFTRASAIDKVELVNLEPCHEDIRRFRKALENHGKGAEGFLNSASPGLITAFQPNQYYPSHEAYLADLATAMRPEYEAIVEAGFKVQLDCPDLAMSRHTGYQDMDEAEFLRTIQQNVEALNEATKNIAPEMMRMHVCWGNYEGPHDFDIPVEKIMDVILSARPATILFEGANPRHEHEWAVWKETNIPEEKILAPGFIDSCSNYIETPELIAQRIERFADFVGKDRVMASSDCGFGTFAGYGKIDPSVAWKKLANLRKGADIADERIN